jgi:hypothetical protein
MLRGISDKPLDQDYWDAQYKAKSTGWDLGKVSPPIKEYIDTLDNKIRHIDRLREFMKQNIY